MNDYTQYRLALYGDPSYVMLLGTGEIIVASTHASKAASSGAQAHPYEPLLVSRTKTRRARRRSCVDEEADSVDVESSKYWQGGGHLRARAALDGFAWRLLLAALLEVRGDRISEHGKSARLPAWVPFLKIVEFAIQITMRKPNLDAGRPSYN